MIFDGIIISLGLLIYYLYKPKQSPMKSLGYYKQIWKDL